MTQEKNEFMKIDGDVGFQSRSKSIFEGLDSLEPKKETHSSSPREIAVAKRRRPRQVPDHVLHPQKWTKYSLEEDGSEQLGGLNPNEVNRHAAFSFLNELKERRKSPKRKDNNTADVDDDSNSRENKSEKHSFTIATERATLTESCPEDLKPQRSSIKQGVNVMSEYVVGQTKHQNKRRGVETGKDSSFNQQIATRVQMSHLLQSDQDNVATGQDESSKETQEYEKVVFTKRKHCSSSRNIRKHKSD